MKLKKNDSFVAEIIDITNLGFGVCKKDGQVVFVSGAVPGDLCEIKIIKVGSSYIIDRSCIYALEDIMYFEILCGILLPLLGTTLGAGCVFFMKNNYSRIHLFIFTANFK